MSTPVNTARPHDDLVTAWIKETPARIRVRGRRSRQPQNRLLFAFYGRISTDGYQDPASSRRRQHDNAVRLTAGYGSIVVEYFDTGYSRSLPWQQRPAAAQLLQDASQSNRGFEAVVIGEYERAFADRQGMQIITLLQSHGVSVWLPETDGPVDLDNPAHRALIMLLGHQSEREILRARMRTTKAMCTQARDQGRHLGGRPPYGYRLTDAGPHPNRNHARWGRRLHRLDPDPATAPHVRWIFAERLTGASTASIARTLNDRGVPSPAAHDPGRNRHRAATRWTLRTVAAILENPRYTGRQVWNRQRTDHRETVPGDKRTSLGPARVWNRKVDWVISTHRAHPALVSEAEFLAAQTISAKRTPHDTGTRRYTLTGLLICGKCGRRLQPHWVHGRPAYRCRHGHTSAHPAGGGPRWIYWPERRVLTETLDQLTGSGHLPALARSEDAVAYLRGRDAVIVCDSAALTIDDPTDDEPATEPPAVTPAVSRCRPTIPMQRSGDSRTAPQTPSTETRLNTGPDRQQRTPPQPSRET